MKILPKYMLLSQIGNTFLSMARLLTTSITSNQQCVCVCNHDNTTPGLVLLATIKEEFVNDIWFVRAYILSDFCFSDTDSPWMAVGRKKQKLTVFDGGVGGGVPYFEGEDDFTVVKRHP